MTMETVILISQSIAIAIVLFLLYILSKADNEDDDFNNGSYI
jgi:hypothetical protein